MMRPQSAARPKSAVTRPTSAVTRPRSAAVRPHSAKYDSLRRPLSAHPISKATLVEELSPIQSGLQEIVHEEKWRQRGRPTSAVSASQKQAFIPTRTLVHSPTRSMSPRKDVSRTLSALRREQALSFAGTVGAADQAIQNPLLSSTTDSGLNRVFSAKCIDLQLNPTEERKERFIQRIRGSSTDGRLVLREAGLGPLAGSAVAAIFVENPVFNALDLSGNALKDQGAKAVAEMLCKTASLITLDLRSNDIGMEGGIALFDSLRQNVSVTELDLGILAGNTRNRVGGKVSEAMKRALSENSSLLTLSLHGNGLGTEGSHQLAKGLSLNTTLRTLDLGLNNVGDGGCIALAAALESASIESLVLSSNAIGNGGGQRVAQALRSGRLLLQSLDLANNQIGQQAASTLGEALAWNSLLCHLNLDKNDIGPEGGVALSKGIDTRSLTHLSLRSNGLHDRGVQNIVQKLRGNTSITRLDLSANSCGDVGAAAVAGMLRINHTLTALYLEENMISDSGGMAVSHALAFNNTLRTLSVKSNLLHDLTGSAFVAGLRGNTGLTELDISWNDINYANYHSIEKLIAEHAASYREGAVPRLRKEMARLKKEEPKLAVREAELVEVNDERDRCHSESQRLSREQEETLQYTVSKLEEMQAQLADAAQELTDRQADVKNADLIEDVATQTQKEKFEEEAAAGAAEVARQEARLEVMTDGERRMRTELEGIESKLEWEQQDEQDQVALLEQELQESNELRERTSAALAELKATLQVLLDEKAQQEAKESEAAAQTLLVGPEAPTHGGRGGQGTLSGAASPVGRATGKDGDGKAPAVPKLPGKGKTKGGKSK